MPMTKQEKITEIKTGFDKLRKGDRNYIAIDEKLNLIKMGKELYVCDSTDDPETCMLTDRIDEADIEIIEKAIDYISRDVADVKRSLDEKRDEEVSDFIPGMLERRNLSEEERKKQEEALDFIPGSSTPKSDKDKKKKDDDGAIDFIPD